MKRRVTIKDIAAEAGVSLGTVHLALSDKPGVGAVTRERIRQIAKEMDYHPNTVASSLKRKTLHLAVCFPEVAGDNRYYYPQLWNGFRTYKESIQDFNISIREFAYPENGDGRSIDFQKRQRIERTGRTSREREAGWSCDPRESMSVQCREAPLLCGSGAGTRTS